MQIIVILVSSYIFSAVKSLICPFRALAVCGFEYLEVSADVVDTIGGGKIILKRMDKLIKLLDRYRFKHTAHMHNGKVIAFATDSGGRTSHTAIMARSLEIPAVVGLRNITANVKNGDFAMILGYPGSTQRFLTSWGVKETIEQETIDSTKTLMWVWLNLDQEKFLIEKDILIRLPDKKEKYRKIKKE